MEQPFVSRLSFSTDQSRITIRHIKDKPGLAAIISGALARQQINIDMIIQAAGDQDAEMSFTIPRPLLARARSALIGLKHQGMNVSCLFLIEWR